MATTDCANTAVSCAHTAALQLHHCTLSYVALNCTKLQVTALNCTGLQVMSIDIVQLSALQTANRLYRKLHKCQCGKLHTCCTSTERQTLLHTHLGCNVVKCIECEGQLYSCTKTNMHFTAFYSSTRDVLHCTYARFRTDAAFVPI